MRSRADSRRKGGRLVDEILLRFGERELRQTTLLLCKLQRCTSLRRELALARALLPRLVELELEIREGGVKLFVIDSNDGELRANLAASEGLAS